MSSRPVSRACRPVRRLANRLEYARAAGAERSAGSPARAHRKSGRRLIVPCFQKLGGSAPQMQECGRNLMCDENVEIVTVPNGTHQGPPAPYQLPAHNCALSAPLICVQVASTSLTTFSGIGT